MADDTKMRAHVESVRRDAHTGNANCKQASIALDTDLLGDVHVCNAVAPETDLQGVPIRKGMHV